MGVLKQIILFNKSMKTNYEHKKLFHRYVIAIESLKTKLILKCGLVVRPTKYEYFSGFFSENDARGQLFIYFFELLTKLLFQSNSDF